MDEKDAFKELISKVVAAEMPEDQDIWTISKDYVTDELFSGRRVGTSRAKSGDFNFITGAEIHVAVEVLQFITGTYNLYKMTRELFMSKMAPNEAQVTSLWAKQMEEAGVPAERAATISKAFAADITRLSVRA